MSKTIIIVLVLVAVVGGIVMYGSFANNTRTDTNSAAGSSSQSAGGNTGAGSVAQSSTGTTGAGSVAQSITQIDRNLMVNKLTPIPTSTMKFTYNPSLDAASTFVNKTSAKVGMGF
jgi:hypothetical protein